MVFVRLDRLYEVNEGTCPRCQLTVHTNEQHCPHCLHELTDDEIQIIQMQAQKYQRSIRNASIFGVVLFVALVLYGLINTFIT